MAGCCMGNGQKKKLPLGEEAKRRGNGFVDKGFKDLGQGNLFMSRG